MALYCAVLILLDSHELYAMSAIGLCANVSTIGLQQLAIYIDSSYAVLHTIRFQCYITIYNRLDSSRIIVQCHHIL